MPTAVFPLVWLLALWVFPREHARPRCERKEGLLELASRLQGALPLAAEVVARLAAQRLADTPIR